MKIIKSSESIPVEHPVFLIFGQPGICKTSLGYSAKDPLLLDFDGGAHRAANRRDTTPIATWKDLELTPETLAPYASIIVDTVGRCLDVMTQKIIEDTPKYGRDGALTLQGYGALKSMFRGWLMKLRAMGKDIVLLSHAKEDKDGDSIIIRPDITGASYSEVMKSADFVGYVYMSGKHRTLDFNPTERWVGKNPGQWKPITIPPVAKATDVLAGLIDDARKALGGISEASTLVLQQVNDWRAAIETYTTIEECNKARAEILKIESPILSPQIKRLMADRVKALGIEYNAAAGSYIVKKEEQVTGMSLRVSVTLLESYRLFMEGDWMAESELIARIKGETVQTPKMAAGIALHSIMERPAQFISPDGYQCDGFVFLKSDIERMRARVDMWGVPEVKGTHNYGGVIVVGKADLITGIHIDEYKTTDHFDSQKYLDSYQWRFLLDIFGASSLAYHVASVKVDERGLVAIADIDSMNVYPYDEMHDHCSDLLRRFLGYIAARGLEPYLQKQQVA